MDDLDLLACRTALAVHNEAIDHLTKEVRALKEESRRQKSAPDDQASDVPEETERERNGRIFWEAVSPEAFDTTWPQKFPTIGALWCDRAERFLAQVRPAPDYGVLRDWLENSIARELSEQSAESTGRRLVAIVRESALSDVRAWLDEQEAHHE